MILTLLVLACVTTGESDPLEPTFIEVSGSGLEVAEDTGDAASGVAPFSNLVRVTTVSGVTLDRNADPYPYEGWVEVTARPGRVAEVSGAQTETDKWGKAHWYVRAEGGQVEAEVGIESSFGATRIWLTAVGDLAEDEPKASYASGVTEAIPIALPTIAELQDVSSIPGEDAHATNPLFGEFVTLRVEDRKVVVASLTAKGFYAVDLDDPLGSYNGLFIYTFNKPEGIAVGDRLALLAGGSQEYIGTTQLSFPVYEAADEDPIELPPASAVLPESFCVQGKVDHAKLEPWESSLIELSSATIPSDFKATEAGTDSSEDFQDYAEYGQWPIEVAGGCTLYAVSNTTVPSFDPTAYPGEDIGPVRGMLAFVQAGPGKWILNLRSADDLPSIESEDDAPAGPSGWPLPFRSTQPAQICSHSGHVRGNHP